MMDARMRSSDIVTEKSWIVSVAGRLCSMPVECRTVLASDRIPNEEEREKINSAGITWEVDENLLFALSANLWKSISSSKDSIRIDTLPSLPTSVRSGFPYLHHGSSSFVASILLRLDMPVTIMLIWYYLSVS